MWFYVREMERESDETRAKTRVLQSAPAAKRLTLKQPLKDMKTSALPCN